MKKLILIMAGVLVFALAGCSALPALNGTSGDATAEQTQNGLQEETPAASDAPFNDVVQESAQPAASASADALEATGEIKAEANDVFAYKNGTIKFEYYDVASDKQATVEVKTDAKSTLRTGLEVVAKQMFNQELDKSPINPNSMKLGKDELRIDFTDKVYEMSLGSSGEASVINSIAKAYLQNVDGLKAVYFSVMGKPYESGHMQIALDQAFTLKANS